MYTHILCAELATAGVRARLWKLSGGFFPTVFHSYGMVLHIVGCLRARPLRKDAEVCGARPK